MSTLSEANGTFVIHILKMLCQSNPSKNVCNSPVSISSALAMVFLGAKGQTAVQISQALGLNKQKDTHQGFLLLLRKLNNPDRKYSLIVANRLFADKTCEVLPTFKEPSLHFHDSEMEQLSFGEAAEESRQHINTWVSKQTADTIPEWLSHDLVDPQTRLVLINALYLKGIWAHQFCKESTRGMPFKINKNEKRQVQTMYQEGMFKLACVEEVPDTLLIMLYEGMELSLVVLLPGEYVDLSKVENGLTFEQLITWPKQENIWATKVKVFLPKFKLQEDYEMKSVFQHLGMMDVFKEAKADLSAMSPERNLFLSKFVHKRVLEVIEEGTEAAAVSFLAFEFPVALVAHHGPLLTTPSFSLSGTSKPRAFCSAAGSYLHKGTFTMWGSFTLQHLDHSYSSVRMGKRGNHVLR